MLAMILIIGAHSIANCTSSTTATPHLDTHFHPFQWFHGIFLYAMDIFALQFFFHDFFSLPVSHNDYENWPHSYKPTYSHSHSYKYIKYCLLCNWSIEKIMHTHTHTGRHEWRKYRLRNNVWVWVCFSMDSGCVQWIFGLSAVPEKSDSLNH